MRSHYVCIYASKHMHTCCLCCLCRLAYFHCLLPQCLVCPPPLPLWGACSSSCERTQDLVRTYTPMSRHAFYGARKALEASHTFVPFPEPLHSYGCLSRARASCFRECLQPHFEGLCKQMSHARAKASTTTSIACASAVQPSRYVLY
jgi:hypothetical protein